MKGFKDKDNTIVVVLKFDFVFFFGMFTIL